MRTPTDMLQKRISPAIACGLSLVWLWLSAAPPRAHARRPRRAAVPNGSEPTAPPRVAKPGALSRAVDRVLRARRLRRAKVGMVVVDLATGKTIYEHNPDLLLNPASVTKVVTTAAALMRLGPEFHFTTTVSARRRPRRGVVRGDLYVKGTGDPRMVTEQMYKLASNIAALGIRRVTGGIVVDDYYFDEQRTGPGWDQDPSDRPYQAPVGAASVNFNALEVLVSPGAKVGAKPRVLTDPATRYVKIQNRARTVKRGQRTRIRVRSVAAKRHNVIRVRGRIALGHPGWSTWRKIDRPPYYFGTVLTEMLRQLGVKVRRGVRRGRVPRAARVLTRVRSRSLAMLLRDVNKVSQNFMAEQLLKTLGAETSGERGSWDNGRRAVENFLAEVGVKPKSFTYRNGSGLNDVNRFTARQIVQVLVNMARHFQVAAEFMASLAVAGADGSVRWRLRGKQTYRRLRVKTGWLAGVSCLAGYVGTPEGRRLAFALLINGLRRSRDGHWTQRRVASLLTSVPDGD